MTFKSFFSQLLVITLLVVLALMGLHQVAGFETVADFSFISVLFFLFFNIVLFLLGSKAAILEDKYVFSRLVLSALFFKMFLAVAVVLTYQQAMRPTTRYFIVPFIFVYIVFTIHETYFMTRLGKPNK